MFNPFKKIHDRISAEVTTIEKWYDARIRELFGDVHKVDLAVGCLSHDLSAIEARVDHLFSKQPLAVNIADNAAGITAAVVATAPVSVPTVYEILHEQGGAPVAAVAVPVAAAPSLAVEPLTV